MVTEGKEESVDEHLDGDSSNQDRMLSGVSPDTIGKSSPSWIKAAEIIKKVRPVPWAFWVLIRSVWGVKNAEKVDLDSSHFTVVEQLVLRAVMDEELVLAPCKRKGQFSDSFKSLGAATTASLCYIHAICKRVSIGLPERVYKALIEDALLRARLGVVLSQFSPRVSIGAGILVGFSGRAGLAIQLASGTEVQASEALKSMATGQDIGDTGMSIYGCDPLQVGALAMIAGGCNKAIASGISAFGDNREEVLIGSEQYDWMLIFSFIEKLRIGKLDQISESDFEYLAINSDDKKELQSKAKQVFRMGHNFDWLLLNLSEMYRP
jgi:hypothetical protein